MLDILDLSVAVAGQTILHQVSLQIKPGEIHALMGPNGSGKSTLGYTLAGHPQYTVTGGTITWQGQPLLPLRPEERARAGLFLSFQNPITIPGVSVYSFLRSTWEAHGHHFGPQEKFANVLAFRQHVQQLASTLNISEKLLHRDLNDGFSGGERKQIELLQLALQQPQLAIIDEIDSGLDIDALQSIATHLYQLSRQQNLALLVITHYQRLLNFLPPDVVHVLKAGRLVAQGGPALVQELEATGYHLYGEEKNG